MASNLISRFLPPQGGSPSVYETIRQHDDHSDTSDLEERAGMALDEENLGEGFEHYELSNAEAADLGESQATNESTAFLGRGDPRGGGTVQQPVRPKWMSVSPALPAADEGDDEVPASLLFEGGEDATLTVGGEQYTPSPTHARPARPVPGPSTRETRARWETTQAQQRLHQDPQAKPNRKRSTSRRSGLAIIDPKERALWGWANVENLDNFLLDVYHYFLGNGIWSIVLSRALNLLTLSFVVGFSTFLTMCVDYKKIPESKTMSKIIIPQCTKKMSGSANLLLWLFAVFWIAKVFQYLFDLRRLRYMHDFYLHLLNIPDGDLQTISWQEIVARLMTLRDANPVTADGIGAKQRHFMGSQSKQRMDAHDIANRLMRKENYLIALFNKDILDLTLPIPFLRNRQLFSKTLEWNLTLCILDYVFNEQGQVRPLFLKDTHRRALSDGLRRRFRFAGFMNVICAPFIVLYLLMLYFFRYFTEFQKNPSQLGSRQYTPLAEWKFREFNELWHLFQRRTNMSYPFASRYVDQFPKDKTVQFCRFVAFVAGALASVLAVASVIDPDLFLGFEITPERTVLFYLGVFGTVWAVARGAVPEENLVFDPEFALKNVTEYTHYIPAEWQGRLHSDEVKREFSQLYQMKVVIFLEEIVSIIFTPFVLWFSLPKCSDRVVDFFREFTIHVDGLGYVCSFAVFDFKKGANNTTQQRRSNEPSSGLRDEYFSTKDGKMLASYYGFLDNYSSNPRGGAPHTYGQPRRQFHPPPAFHGLLSQELGAEAGISGQPWQGMPTPPAVRRASTVPEAHSIHRTTSVAPRGHTSASPMPSMLLDPQHQPSSSGFQRMAKHQRRQSRYRTGPIKLAEVQVEEDEDIDHPSGPPVAGTTSTGSTGPLGDDSNLGESWKITRAGAHEDDGDDVDDVDTVTGEKGAGVLGLLYQFQKAQTEGRGGGVNI
ncbi:MAG: autophagy protein atg9 [Piccolia ochrophora]|nr:MAG: autophagy protein atg9 [Piccolia ochrophora]